jgi:hypothetical protein
MHATPRAELNMRRCGPEEAILHGRGDRPHAVCSRTWLGGIGCGAFLDLVGAAATPHVAVVLTYRAGCGYRCGRRSRRGRARSLAGWAAQAPVLQLPRVHPCGVSPSIQRLMLHDEHHVALVLQPQRQVVHPLDIMGV